MPPALAGHKTACEKHYVYLNLLWFWKFTSKLAGTFCLFFTVLTIIMINKVIYNCFSLLGGLFDSHHQSNMTSIDKSIFQDMRLACKKQSMITFVTTDYYPKILWSIYAKIRSRVCPENDWVWICFQTTVSLFLSRNWCIQCLVNYLIAFFPASS